MSLVSGALAEKVDAKQMAKFHVITEATGTKLGILDAQGNGQPHEATQDEIADCAESSHDFYAAALAAAGEAGADRWVIDESGDSEYISGRP
jgi:hypothetical protein